MAAVVARTDEAKAIRHIALLIAMEAEAKHFMEEYHLVPVNFQRSVVAPGTAYQGALPNGGKLTLIVHCKDPVHGVDSVGTVPAALCAMVAINEFSPDVLINAGTCGGFKRVGAAIGDAFIGTAYKHHDRRIPLPGFREYGKGNHSAPACQRMIEALGCKAGVITSGNSLDCTDEDMREMLDNDAAVKDMEAAAVAWVADLAGVPFLSLKVVTDIVDGGRPTHEEFLENLSAAAKSLQGHLPKLLEYLVNKRLDDL